MCYNIPTMEPIEAKSPQDIPKLFARAWNNRRAEDIAALFEDDADFINVVGIWWENRDDIRKAHDYGLRVIFNQSELRLGKVKVKKLSPDTAVIHARMRLTGQTPKESVAGVRHNLFLFVVRRHGNRWLCVSAQNTDIVAGAETRIRDQEGNLIPADYRK